MHLSGCRALKGGQVPNELCGRPLVPATDLRLRFFVPRAPVRRSIVAILIALHMVIVNRWKCNWSGGTRYWARTETSIAVQECGAAVYNASTHLASMTRSKLPCHTHDSVHSALLCCILIRERRGALRLVGAICQRITRSTDCGKLYAIVAPPSTISVPFSHRTY